MMELLWLLLPVAAASGWMMARRSTGIRANSVKRDLSPDYFRGLNYVLNEQPDKAIEVFIKMLEVDSNTVETHLALGNLFRRRGEVDRAIRIHQNIIARPTLSTQQRGQALYELGLDYMRAGVLDRAENLFRELIDIGEYVPQALNQLAEIYEQEKDWEKAIEVREQLGAEQGREVNDVIAQYYCELAEAAIDSNDTGLARSMLKRAFSSDRDCVRASLLLGEVEARTGDCRTAIKAYQRVEQQDPKYLPEIIAPLEECYRELGMPEELASYLRDVLERHEDVSAMLGLAEVIREQDGERDAEGFIIEHLRQRPSVRGLDRLIGLNLGYAEGAARDNLLILQDLVQMLLKNRPVYKCNKCGFSGRTMHWHCPSCKNWNSVKPLQDVVGG